MGTWWSPRLSLRFMVSGREVAVAEGTALAARLSSRLLPDTLAETWPIRQVLTGNQQPRCGEGRGLCPHSGAAENRRGFSTVLEAGRPDPGGPVSGGDAPCSGRIRGFVSPLLERRLRRRPFLPPTSSPPNTVTLG